MGAVAVATAAVTVAGDPDGTAGAAADHVVDVAAEARGRVDVVEYAASAGAEDADEEADAEG